MRTADDRTVGIVDDTVAVHIAELHAAYPETRIETAFDLTQRVNCDSSRIAQLFSNLLANAISHGSTWTSVVGLGTPW